MRTFKRHPLWLLGALGVASTLSAAILPGRAHADTPLIVDLPISFKVNLSNTSPYTDPALCPASSTGPAATVRGHLVAPVGALLQSTRSATLYLHGFAVRETQFHFDAVSGYNYAKLMAEKGHVSITIDRIGYGASVLPAPLTGNSICMGIEIDVEHQVVDQLRSGNYSIGIIPLGIPFQRVAIGGASGSANTGPILAAWYHNVDAAIHMVWSDLQVNADYLGRILNEVGASCASSAAGYGLLGDDATFAEGFTYNVAPEVASYLLSPRTQDPCGNLFTVLNETATSQALASKVKVPILVIGGDHDAIFAPTAFGLQAASYTKSKVTLKVIPNVGHDLVLNLNAAAVRAAIDAWLSPLGF